MQLASYTEKEPSRFRRGKSWKINMFGKNSDIAAPDPQAFRLDLNAHQRLESHFHIVDQFQVFIAGSGTIGRDPVQLVTVHYADHHTGYGPLVASAQGLSYLTLRSKTDAGLVYLTTPNVREQLRPTKRRHRTSDAVALSIEPVLRDRTELRIDVVIEEQPGDDGMNVTIYRIGPDMTAQTPDPAGGGGQYLIVLNGSLIHEGQTYKPYSLLFLKSSNAVPTVQAGPDGLEMMVTQFPREDEWMLSI
ncbi:hypothetical protein GOZ83_12220 [Agrobacterium vitis]|uniref:hypothetical protein n=1 Tax=Rhizobium/Agrobacterium group TaxID=227290 RepID=UPI0012E7E94B|nr:MULTISPECIES: hypothetical protein [Rhizobium/Agrobacterium group]MCF1495731.1 hypothetical protein [Allorhizobium ampelinum]MVA45834.1 hypothetical protein [Agrobacterium vitis]